MIDGRSTLITTILSAVLAGTLAMAPVAEACTRLVYLGPEGNIITARSMDWKSDVATNLWILPRGIERSGQAGENSIKWKAKYGSVVATGYDISTTDGVNDAGLMANVLWLVESEYPKFDGQSKPGLTIAAWAQYALDNFATVAEAVEALEREPFMIVTDNVPGENRLTTLHLSLSDATGDSAIIEYIKGKQVIHHDRKYQVMTNSPTFDEQLALNAYWKKIGGTVMLPGTNRAADRFCAFLLCRCHSQGGGRKPGARQRLQRHPQRLGPLWSEYSRGAEYLLDPLAYCRRSQAQTLLLRICADAQYLLGRSQNHRFFCRDWQGQETRPWRKPGSHLFGRRDPFVQGRQTVPVSRPLTTINSLHQLKVTNAKRLQVISLKAFLFWLLRPGTRA